MKDLEKYGILGEMMGRLTTIAPLKELSKEALLRILQEPKNAILKQQTTLFGRKDVEIEFTDAAKDAIVEKAKARKTGARALKSIIEESLLDVKFNSPDIEGVTKIIITDDVINNNATPKYEYGCLDMSEEDKKESSTVTVK